MFNKNKFSQTQFVPRTAELRLDSLSDFFDGEPIFIVRGMTASELAKCNESATQNQSLETLISALTNDAEKVRAIREQVGLIGDETPHEIMKRIDQLVFCSVEPELDRQSVLKLAEAFPIEFYRLTNKIIELTGMGMDIKK
jgi:hypothetical protein